jgi:hypothetical protein
VEPDPFARYNAPLDTALRGAGTREEVDRPDDPEWQRYRETWDHGGVPPGLLPGQQALLYDDEAAARRDMRSPENVEQDVARWERRRAVFVPEPPPEDPWQRFEAMAQQTRAR